MFTNSIRWRLQLWLGFLLLCLVSGFAVTVYQFQRLHLRNQLDEELSQRVAALSANVRRPPMMRLPPFPEFEEGKRLPPPDGNELPLDRVPRRRGGPGGLGDFRERFGPREVRLLPAVANLFDAGTNGFYFAVWGPDGLLLKTSTNAPAEIPRPIRLRNDTGLHARTRGGVREAFQFTEIGDCILAGRSTVEHQRALGRLSLALLAAGAGVLALGLGVGWLLTTRAIRPIEEISAAASRISDGHLSERVAVAEPDNELGRLATVLNSTFARLEAAFSRQKQFTADAAHELRTPLAVIISETQTTLARERSPAEYRETIEACLDTAQQMRRLTDSMLALARSDAQAEQVEPRELDLAAETRACVERLAPLAAERSVQIRCDLAPATVHGSPDRLAQVVTNLVANAIHYNKPGGEVRVSTAAENGWTVLRVADTGIGISSEDLPHIFERFYRADKARSRADGRSGLGLAIVKAIVDAGGGRIEVSSQVNAGTTVIVKLPDQRL